uniref:Peptidase M48 domain-containing protein n=1 Tax=Amorphochlora amoebiformis TaxID=1561963 RepID=A0A7S0DUH0_9EUKA
MGWPKRQMALLARRAWGGRIRPTIRRRPFRSVPRRDANPFVIRIGAIFAGRLMRSAANSYLKGIPKHKRRRYFVGGVFLLSGSLGCGFAGYYYWHLTPCPITGRQRYLSISRDEEIKVAQQISKHQADSWKKEGTKCLGVDDPRVERVRDISVRLIRALPTLELAVEQSLEDKVIESMEWSVTLVDKKVANAHVLPNGEIYVFTGLLDMCGEGSDGDSMLANVIGHEISHALLRHGGERLSKRNSFLAAQSLITFMVWTLMPDNVFDVLGIRTILGMEAIQEQLLHIVLTLPNSRDQESEADYLGLLLSSAACYDPRQAAILWERMSKVHEGKEPPELLSTHPNPSKRAVQLREWQDKAFSIQRDTCGCNSRGRPKRRSHGLTGLGQQFLSLLH